MYQSKLKIQKIHEQKMLMLVKLKQIYLEFKVHQVSLKPDFQNFALYSNHDV
jgi:hypothetical protein